MKILIKGGRVIDPINELDKKVDLLVDGGKIAKIGDIAEKADEVINAGGKIVSPGFIDLHTHLREPGREDEERIETALLAAVKGGWTTVCAMPNTEPPCDNKAQVNFLLEKAKKADLANLVPIGTITKGRAGETLSEMKDLARAGVTAISDDGDSVRNPELMRKAMEYASMLDILVISHCEDKDLAAEGVMREGYWSTVLGLAPISAEAESVIVERDIKLAALTGAKLHIAHVSTRKSVEAIREAKKKGIKVTAEITPHHFTLKDEDLKSYDTNLKVNPPLGSEDDVKALKEALKDGTIDAIATDHAPHLASEKETEFNYAPFGMIGLESALSLAVMELIGKKALDWPGLIGKLSANPARILGIPKGTLGKGAAADITILDPEKTWIFEKEAISSLSHNSPFIGWKMKGAVTDVIVGGKVVLKDGKRA